MPPKNTVIPMNMKNINVNSNASNIVESKNSTNSTKNNDTDKKKGIFSDFQEKWKKLSTTKKAGIVGAMAGTLITLSPLIGVLATLTLPGLILGGIAYGAVKGAKSKVVTTADGISKTGKYIKSNVKNAVDQCNPTKKLSNAKEFIQDIHSEAYELLTASESTTVDVDKTKKLTFHKTIAEMIQDKSVVKAIQILVENQKILDISSKDIERCVEKGKSTFNEDKEDFKALVERISAAAQKSFSKTDEFKEEVEKVQKENSPNTKLEVNTKSVEQVNDNNIEK